MNKLIIIQKHSITAAAISTNGTITHTAPILKKFINQPEQNLKNWATKWDEMKDPQQQTQQTLW